MSLTAIPSLLHIAILALRDVVADVAPTVVPGTVTALAGRVEAGLASDGVIIDMEVTVVDHVVALLVICWTVDGPEAGVVAHPARLPHAVGGEGAAARSDRVLWGGGEDWDGSRLAGHLPGI